MRKNGESARKIEGGYVLLARRIQESAVWGWDADHVRLLVYLLLNARWDSKPKQIGEVTIRRGQVLKSFRKIAEENEYTSNQRVRRWSTSRVKRMIERLEKAGTISTFGTDLGTLFTLQNFEVFQEVSSYQLRDPGTDPGTPAEHLRNNRKKDKKGKNPSSPHPAEYSEAFEEFWKVYPPRPNDSKAEAYRNWNARLNNGVPPDSLILGAERYAAYVKGSSTKPQFIKYAKTFLGPDKHWEMDWAVPESMTVEESDAEQVEVREIQKRWVNLKPDMRERPNRCPAGPRH